MAATPVAGKTLLELCNLLIQKCGMAGGSMTTVSGAVNSNARVAAWINESYLNIQMAQKTWRWMRRPTSFVTSEGIASYTYTDDCYITDFGSWRMDSFRRYITSTGVRSEIFLNEILYSDWRDIYSFGNQSLVYGDVRFIAEGPDQSLNLGMIPDATEYTVVGDYYHCPYEILADADTPSMPAKFHMLIVYGAMVMYGMYESAPEVVQEAQRLYGAMLRKLTNEQLEQAMSGGSLA